MQCLESASQRFAPRRECVCVLGALFSLLPQHQTMEVKSLNSGTSTSHLSAIKKGAQLIDDCLKRDEDYPELWDFFNQTSSTQYSVDETMAQFFIKKKILIPAALLEQYNCILLISLFGC
jgi:hypothetical protein